MTPTRSRLVLLGLCAILLLMCVLRLPSLVAPIWSVDDGTHAIIANKILEGGLPYRDAVDHRAPLPWYVCALTFLFTGPNNMNALRIVLVGLSGIIIVFIFLIGRLTVGDK
jgi:predicted membrane-bound mannosyltransferase